MKLTPTRSVFLHEFSARALADTFESRVAVKGGMGRDGTSASAFKKRLKREIANIRRAGLRGAYTPSAYKEHLVSKGPGKEPRVLSIPTVRDRLVLRALNQAIASLIPESRSSLAPAVVGSLIRVLERGSFDSFVRLDVKNFYPSIRHAHVEEALKRRLRNGPLISQTMRMIRTPTLGRSRPKSPSWPSIGVPQGLSISNNLAEIAMLDFDEKLRSNSHLSYHRFVDDILVLCDASTVEQVAIELRTDLARFGLETHPLGNDSKSTSGLVAEPFEFLGYRFEWPRITVRGGSVTSIKTSLTRVMTAYRKYAQLNQDNPLDLARALRRCELRLNLKISGCVYEGTRRGWIAFFSQIRHQQLLKHLDWYVTSEMKRFGIYGAFEPKTFVVAYRHAAHGQPDLSGFVPNFDILSTNEKRSVLIEYFMLAPGWVAALDPTEVDAAMRAKLNRLVSDLDRDTGTGYR